jgi:hypothetical protein
MQTHLIILLLLISTALCGQTVKVKSETARIKGEMAEGFEVELKSAINDIESHLAQYLKPVGKTKKIDGALAISLPLIYGKNYTSPIYAVVKEKGDASAAWIGIKSNEWPAETNAIKTDIEKLVQEFGLSFQRTLIQRQIDESARALSAVERQQQRLVSQHKDLLSRTEDNKREKLQLEKAIENNKLELETLIKKTGQNKKDQDSIAVAADQIKKVIEMQKEKQRSVQ